MNNFNSICVRLLARCSLPKTDVSVIVLNDIWGLKSKRQWSVPFSSPPTQRFIRGLHTHKVLSAWIMCTEDNKHLRLNFQNFKTYLCIQVLVTTWVMTLISGNDDINTPALFRPVSTLSIANTLLTYLLTPWCRVHLEKLTGLQLVKKFPAFHGTRRFITALTSVRHLSLSWASPIQSIYPHPNSWKSILIISTHLCLGLPSGLLPTLTTLLVLLLPWIYVRKTA